MYFEININIVFVFLFVCSQGRPTLRNNFCGQSKRIFRILFCYKEKISELSVRYWVLVLYTVTLDLKNVDETVLDCLFTKNFFRDICTLGYQEENGQSTELILIRSLALWVIFKQHLWTLRITTGLRSSALILLLLLQSQRAFGLGLLKSKIKAISCLQLIFTATALKRRTLEDVKTVCFAFNQGLCYYS